MMISLQGEGKKLLTWSSLFPIIYDDVTQNGVSERSVVRSGTIGGKAINHSQLIVTIQRNPSRTIERSNENCDGRRFEIV